MITPGPTSKIAPHLVRGTLEEKMPEGAEIASRVVITPSGTPAPYRLHLIPTGPIATAVGKRIVGTVAVGARRIDRVDTGGRFIEPVWGAPQRVQGTVIGTDADHALGPVVIVNAGVPVHLIVFAPGQSPEAFGEGELVGCDVMEGATFTPEG